VIPPTFSSVQLSTKKFRRIPGQPLFFMSSASTIFARRLYTGSILVPPPFPHVPTTRPLSILTQTTLALSRKLWRVKPIAANTSERSYPSASRPFYPSPSAAVSLLYVYVRDTVGPRHVLSKQLINSMLA
jgi:hypothetical protein